MAIKDNERKQIRLISEMSYFNGFTDGLWTGAIIVAIFWIITFLVTK